MSVGSVGKKIYGRSRYPKFSEMSGRNLNLGKGAVLAREIQAQVHKVFTTGPSLSGGVEFINNVGSGADKLTFGMAVGLHDGSISHPGLEMAYHDGESVKHPVLSLGFVGNDYSEDADPGGHGRPCVVIGSASQDDKVDLVVQGGSNTYMVFDASAQQLRLGAAGSGKSSGEFLKIVPGPQYPSSATAIHVGRGGLSLNEGSAMLQKGNLSVQDGDMSVLKGSVLMTSGSALSDYELSGSGADIGLKAGKISMQDANHSSFSMEDGHVAVGVRNSAGPVSVRMDVGDVVSPCRGSIAMLRDAAGENSMVSLGVINTDGMDVAHESKVQCDPDGLHLVSHSKKIEIVGPVVMKQAPLKSQAATFEYATLTAVAQSTLDSNADADTRVNVATGSVFVGAKAHGAAAYTSRIRVRPSEILITGHDVESGVQQVGIVVDTGLRKIAFDADDMDFSVGNVLFDENTTVTFTTAPNFEGGVNLVDLELEGDLTVGGTGEFVGVLKVPDTSGGNDVLIVDATSRTIAADSSDFSVVTASFTVDAGGSSLSMSDNSVSIESAEVALTGSVGVVIAAPSVQMSGEHAVMGSESRFVSASTSHGGVADAIVLGNGSDFSISSEGVAGSSGGVHVQTTAHFQKDVVMDGKLIVHGNIDVRGVVNSIATTETELHVQDKTIVLNKASDTEQDIAAVGSGVVIRKGPTGGGAYKSVMYQELQEANGHGGQDSGVAGVFQTSNSLHIRQGASESGFMQEPSVYFGGSAGELPRWRIAVVEDKLVFQKRVAGFAGGAPSYATKFTIDENM